MILISISSMVRALSVLITKQNYNKKIRISKFMLII